MNVETTATCANPECGRDLVPSNRWAKLTKAERAALRATGVYPKCARGLCGPCHDRARKDGTLLDYQRETMPTDMAVDEYRRMDRRHGESMAARCRRLAPRLGMSAEALERTLNRAGVRNPVEASGLPPRRPNLHTECQTCRSHITALSWAERDVRRTATRLAADPDSAAARSALDAARTELAEATAHRDMHLDADHDDTEVAA